ncbi:MAG: endolytic transglycosylase MltG [Oscillospiraceae bacterium]|nr:endolytic transglycosylase MltG [Oscillospiraceae bacterium]
MKKFKITKKAKVLIVSFLVFIVLCAFANMAEVGGWYRAAGSVQIEVPSGTGTRGIAKILKKNGVIGSEILFYLNAKEHSAHFKAGVHEFEGRRTYARIIQELKVSPGLNGIRITIPEGFESYRIAERLEENGLTTAKSFLEECDKGNFDTEKYPFLKDIKRKENRLEGYLFPATYDFAKGETNRQMIEKMLDKFNREFTAEMYAKCGVLGRSVDEIITLASIIEREAVGEADRDVVASVFWNRLNARETWMLQSCATVQYVLKERKPVLSNADVKINSPYNTYIHTGLPIGPIASPGLLSIKSALNPAKSDYFFFVWSEGKGKHIFSKTYDEHLRAKNE